MTTLNPVHFSKEIAYNLQIMESTLKSGIAVDQGFLSIFKNDIQSLSAHKIDNQVTADLNLKLQGVAAKLQVIASGSIAQADTPSAPSPMTLFSSDAKFEDVVVPLIQGRKEFSELIKTYDSGPTKIGLEYLDAQFYYRPIKGDGHCLFRSIAAGILFEVERKGPQEKERILNQLMKEIEPLGNKAELDAGLASLIQAMDDITDKNRGVEDIIGNQKQSDALVKFLRFLAVEHNKVHGLDVNQEEANATAGSVEAYHANMVDMSKAECGGHVEIHALANALGIKVQLLHPEALGKDNVTLEHLAFGPDSASNLWLLYRPGHYDLAFPKT